MIIWLNLLAFGGLEAVFLWPLVLGLYWERANAAGALRDDRRRRAVCRARHPENSVPGLSSYRALATAKVCWLLWWATVSIQPVPPAPVMTTDK